MGALTLEKVRFLEILDSELQNAYPRKFFWPLFVPRLGTPSKVPQKNDLRRTPEIEGGGFLLRGGGFC